MSPINYSDYITEQLDRSISYSEYLSAAMHQGINVKHDATTYTFQCDTWVDLDEEKHTQKMKQREEKIDKLFNTENK